MGRGGGRMERKRTRNSQIFPVSYTSCVLNISQLTAYKLNKQRAGVNFLWTGGYINKMNENHIPSEILVLWL